MTALSVTTIALSITDGCPGLAFYILEIIINTSMIVEVGIRFVAFGRVSRTIRLSTGLTCLMVDLGCSNFGSLRSTSWTSSSR